MTEDEFRAAAKEDFVRLLKHWTNIEYWLKRAEQINAAAVIPAINELRYAARQFFNAHRVLENSPLSDTDRKKIAKRISVADQYLDNAEHDIADAIVSFYKSILTDVEARFARNVITSHFPGYPALLERIRICEKLVAESRENYELRTINYDSLRHEHLPIIFRLHETLIDAQVSAQEEINRTKAELAKAEGSKNTLWWATVIAVPIAVISLVVTIVLSVYLWAVTPEKYCGIHKDHFGLGIICSKDSVEHGPELRATPIPKPPVATMPSGP